MRLPHPRGTKALSLDARRRLATPLSRPKAASTLRSNTMTNFPATTTASSLPADAKTVQDLKLADALGYERPANIRNLIKRHADLLGAMGPLLHREAMVGIGSGAKRAVTEYHLNQAQAAFIIAKAGTKRADSLTVKMAEVFTLFSEGGLVAAHAEAQASLDTIEERERQRRLALHAEERAGRSNAFEALSRSRGTPSKRQRDNAKWRRLARKAEREAGL
jgi:hypothetical protein